MDKIVSYLPIKMVEVEKRHIEFTLNHFKGNKSLSAKSLGMSRSTLIRKIKQYGLN